MTLASDRLLVAPLALIAVLSAGCALVDRGPPPATIKPVALPAECDRLSAAEADRDLIVQSDVYDTAERVRVHLTPCGNLTSGPVSVLYLLHGANADETQWPDVDVLVAIDNAVVGGRFPPSVVVIPDAASAYSCLKCADRLSEHLLGEIESAINVLVPVDPTRRAIGGISRGGGFALSVASQSPGEFQGVGAHSPVRVPELVLAGLADQGIFVFLDSGSDDSLADGTIEMAEALTRLGDEPQLSIGVGRHDRAYWRSQALIYAAFYGEVLS